MYGKVKLTKRQIKEDKFTTFMLNAKHQFTENWQFFVIGIAAVVLIIVAGIYYTNSQQTKKDDAAQQFSRALLDYHSGNTQLTIMSLSQLLEDYPGSRVADQATFLLAKVNYEAQNYPEALRYYQMYVDQFKGNKLRRASALAGMAACYENQGDYLSAAQQFEAAIKEYSDGPLVSDHHFAAMRAYLEVGDVEAARSHLEAISKEFAGTNLERQALRIFTEKSKS